MLATCSCQVPSSALRSTSRVAAERLGLLEGLRRPVVVAEVAAHVAELAQELGARRPFGHLQRALDHRLDRVELAELPVHGTGEAERLDDIGHRRPRRLEVP
jgi:hypothetical protein